MEVQETNIKTRMKSFHRVTTKYKSYYPHAEGISQNGCNKMAAQIFYYFKKKFFLGRPRRPPPIQNKVNTYFINAVENTATKVPTSLGDSSNKQNETDNVKKIISEYNKRGVHIKNFCTFSLFSQIHLH